MYKKLLATSALVSTLVVANTTFAQTTITGSMDLALRSSSYDAAGGAASDTTLGRETQLNIANKGNLNIGGLSYAAGFSLEFDGGQALAEGAGSTSNENVYINIIKGATTLHIGTDHIQNSQNDLLNTAGDLIDEINGILVGGTIDNVGERSPKEDMGVGIIQNFGNGITGSYLYTPNNTNTGVGNQASGTSTTGTNSAYEVGVRGTNVANSGISFDLWKNKVQAPTAATQDVTGKAYAVNYNTGPFGAGFAILDTDDAAGLEVKTKMGHLSYAISKDLTASAVYATTSDQAIAEASRADEKIKSLMVGYSLGPVGVLITASQIENIGASSTGNDANLYGISLNTKF
jgi:hypothetical protein